MAADQAGGNSGTARRKGRRPGFVSPSRKLTDEQAAEIRYRVGGLRNLSERAAAKEYRVSQRTIRGILAGRLYVKQGRPKRAPSSKPTVLAFAPLPPKAAELPARSYALAPRRSA